MRSISAKRALALLLGLVALELLLRLAFAYPPLARRLATNDDLSYRRAWVEQHRRGIDGIGEVDRHDPLLGWRPRPDLEIPSSWNGKRLTTNSQGFRSARDFTLPKRPSVTRMLALGDSFTFGEEVSDDETWTHQLDAMCPDLEVFNLGVHGYGHDQMLLLLRELGRDYAPDVVLLGYLKTDTYRNLLSFRDYAKPRFELSGGELTLRGVPVPTPAEFLERERWRPRLLDFGVILSTRFQNLSGIRSYRKGRITTALLEGIALESRALGARSAFAFFPAGSELTDPAESEESESSLRQSCSEIEGVACTSVAPPLLAAEQREEGCCTEPGGYHWSARAHQLAAESLLDFLLESGLLRTCGAVLPGLSRASS